MNERVQFYDLATYGGHFKRVLHVPDKNWVETAKTQEIRTGVSEAILYATSLLVLGVQGRGKSSAVGLALRCLLPGTDIVPVLLELKTDSRGRQLLVDLHHQLLGVYPREGQSPSVLVAALRRALSEERRVVVIDDAQLANPRAILTMALLCAEAETTFALIIIGTPELRDKLRPEVYSRGTGQVWVGSLTDDDVVGALEAYHSLFRTADPELLREWNATHARGEFRFWARTLGRAWDLRHKTGGELNQTLFDLAVYNAPDGVEEEES